MSEVGIERLGAGDGEEHRASVTRPIMPWLWRKLSACQGLSASRIDGMAAIW